MSIPYSVEIDKPEAYQGILTWGELMAFVLEGHGEMRGAPRSDSPQRQCVPASFYLLMDTVSVPAFLELGERILAWLCPSTMHLRNQEIATPHGVRSSLSWNVCLGNGHWFSIWGVTPEQYSASPMDV